MIDETKLREFLDGYIKEAKAANNISAVHTLDMVYAKLDELTQETADTLANNGNAAIGLGMLKGAMVHHPDYAWTWHCNIAMAAVDEGVPADVANKIAERFMNLAFDAKDYEPK